MLIFGADHGGFPLKEALLHRAEQLEQAVVDVGAQTLDPTDDYPQFAFQVARLVQADEGAMGVLLCRSGAGMAIAANRLTGIRAVQCRTKEEVQHAREHNHANILVLAADSIDEAEAWELVHVFSTTPCSLDPRHVRRVQQLDRLP